MKNISIIFNKKIKAFIVCNKKRFLFTVRLNEFLPKNMSRVTYAHFSVLRILVRCGLIKILKKSN